MHTCTVSINESANINTIWETLYIYIGQSYNQCPIILEFHQLYQTLEQDTNQGISFP